MSSSNSMHSHGVSEIMSGIKFVWRLLLSVIVALLLWVFSHDYVAESINARMDQQVSAAKKQNLNFSWDLAIPNDVVTFFDSDNNGSYFKGKALSVSFKMPTWPLVPKLYQKMVIDFEVDVDNEIEVALETSDLETQTFYTARFKLASGRHVVDLMDLTWDVNGATNSESPLAWKNIPRASTWVLRMFAPFEANWQIKSIALPQTGVYVDNGWVSKDCGAHKHASNHSDSNPEQSLQDCITTNQMIKLDHTINRYDTAQLIKFKGWQKGPLWLLVLFVVALSLVLFVGMWRYQIAVLVVAAVTGLSLFFDLIKAWQWVDGYATGMLAVAALMSVLYVMKRVGVFIGLRNDGLPGAGLPDTKSRKNVILMYGAEIKGACLKQKRSAGLWFIVLIVAVILWYLGNWGLSFLPLIPTYFLWALVQQTLMIKLYDWLEVSKGENQSYLSLWLFVAACFAVVHVPNHYLMLLTFVAAVFWIWVWSRTKNLLLMAVSHSLWALLLYQWAGESWLFSARVGAFFL